MLKKYGYPTFLALLGLAGGGGIVWLFGQTVEMAVNYPWPLAACMLIAFVLGLSLSLISGISKRWIEQKEARRKKEEAHKRQIGFLKNIPRAHKVLLREMYENGGIGDYHFMEPSIAYLQKYSCIEPPQYLLKTNLSTFTITPKTMTLLEENEEAIFKG